MIYGHRWKANFGLTDDGTWRLGLSGITPAQLAAGLAKCVDRKPAPGEEDWPPTLSEFRTLCLPEHVHAIHRDYVALPKPPQDPGVVETALTHMRELLR